MGYTSFTKELVENIIKEYRPKRVVDLGAQNDFSGPSLPAPYISEWYESMGIEYSCIDLNGENGAIVGDLGKKWYPLDINDIVGDIGTSEHIGADGHFDWEAIYNCWLTKFGLCKIGGLIVSENPKTGHWKNHGFQWYCQSFYHQLESACDMKILDIGEVCATGNCDTGQNVYCVLLKTGDEFISFDYFKMLDIKFE